MLIIDRFEADQAVIEFDQQTFNLPRVVLPSNAQVGDVITIRVDQKKTTNRQKLIEKLSEQLFD